jgi:hypothetical protein
MYADHGFCMLVHKVEYELLCCGRRMFIIGRKSHVHRRFLIRLHAQQSAVGLSMEFVSDLYILGVNSSSSEIRCPFFFNQAFLLVSKTIPSQKRTLMPLCLIDNDLNKIYRNYSKIDI